NTYYGASFEFPSAYDFIRRYHDIWHTLTIHAKANMPGKVLVFFLLRALSPSPEIQAFWIVLCSALGGYLLALMAREMTDGNRKAALYACILYQLVPSKLYFAPLLNILSPLPILLGFYWFLRFLTTEKKIYLAGLAICLYVVFLFEPLPLVTGLVFAAFLFESVQRSPHPVKLLTSSVWVTIAVLVGFHLLILGVFRFNLFRAFANLMDFTANFNLTHDRNYAHWTTHNLKDLFVNSIASSQTLIFFLAVAAALWRRYKTKATTRMTGGDLFAVAMLATALINNYLGLILGETIRIWIFIAVFIQISVAVYCAVPPTTDAPSSRTATFYIVAATSFAQLVLTFGSLRFAWP
ncbi:MAG: hypothetical protein AAB425_12155, partial [Bdellovibrionota bacterium]